MMRDLDLKFLNEFVYACPTDGYCDPVPGIERHVDPDVNLWVTREGDIRNVWRIPMKGIPKSTMKYHHCIKCLRPVGQWEARRVNEYFGHKAPTTESILDSLPEIDI